MSDQLKKTVSAHQRWLYTLAALVGILLLVVVWLSVKSLSENILASGGMSAGNIQVKEEMDTSDPVPPRDPSPEVSSASGAGGQAPAGVTTPPESRTPDLLPPESAEKLIKNRTGFALTYLKRKNFGRLATKYIHPEKGVRFFPMGLGVSGKSFSAQILPDAMSAPALYTWTDAAGRHAVEATFSDYYKKYVYDQDFLSATQIHFNSIAFPGKYGLSAALITTQFPGCIFVEYPKNGKSLVLVYERSDERKLWYLVGVIHSE